MMNACNKTSDFSSWCFKSGIQDLDLTNSDQEQGDVTILSFSCSIDHKHEPSESKLSALNV